VENGCQAARRSTKKPLLEKRARGYEVQDASVFERDHGSIAAAEGSHFQQSSMGLGHGHNRAVAIDGVTGGGEVPRPALFPGRLLAGGGGGLILWCEPGDG